MRFSRLLPCMIVLAVMAPGLAFAECSNLVCHFECTKSNQQLPEEARQGVCVRQDFSAFKKWLAKNEHPLTCDEIADAARKRNLRHPAFEGATCRFSDAPDWELPRYKVTHKRVKNAPSGLDPIRSADGSDITRDSLGRERDGHGNSLSGSGR